MDDLSSGFVKAVVPDAQLVEGDISNPNLIRQICDAGIDVVMHFAAFTKVSESMQYPAKYYQNNVIKTARLLDNLRANDVGNFIYSSSAAIYGNPEEVPITEDSHLHPINPYGWTKLIVEQVLRDYDNAYGFRSVALRYFNAAGAYGVGGEDHRPESHLIPLALNAATNGSTLEVYGADYPTRDGTCIRDYVHVKDIAEAHILAMHYLLDGRPTDCFNLGTGTGSSVLEVLRCIEQMTGHKVGYNLVPRRAGDAAILVASPGKAQRVLGWTKRLLSLDEIVVSAWEWKQEHPFGFGDRLH